MGQEKKVVILLPAWNEEDNIERFLGEIFEQEKSAKGWKFEILVALDERSSDKTLDILKSISKKDARVHFIQVEPGIGVALIEGHRYAIKNLKPIGLAQMDSDGQVGAEVLPRMLKKLDEGYNFVVGSRFSKGGKNNLSWDRKMFTWGACLYCRIVMGPWDILEFTNSARAFTPELFNKIDLSRVPWRERTFINQPAFLNAAVEAGAKYIEVPLEFKDRAAGYSKNKTFNYTYDIITYAIEARLYKWGFKVPFFRLAARAKTLVKFGMVGFTGTLIDFIFYKIFIIYFGQLPPTAKAISTEIAIVNNFLLNNYWTFKNRKTNTNIFQRFAIFNLVSLGGLAISVLIIKLLYDTIGEGMIDIGFRKIAYNNLYFFATIPPVLIWNFSVNHFITWRKKKKEG